MRLLLALLTAASVSAHPGAPSLWTIQAGSSGITGRIVLSLPDLSRMRELDVNGDGFVEGWEVVARSQVVQERLLRHFVLRTTKGAAPARVTSVRQQNSDSVELLVRYELPLPVAELEIESTFFELTDPGHGTFCRLDLGGRVESFVLDVNRPALRIETGDGSGIPFKQLEWTIGGLSALLLMRLTTVRRGAIHPSKTFLLVFRALLSGVPGRWQNNYADLLAARQAELARAWKQAGLKGKIPAD